MESEIAAFRTDLELEMWWKDAQTCKRTDGQTRLEIFPRVLHDIGPLGPLPETINGKQDRKERKEEFAGEENEKFIKRN